MRTEVTRRYPLSMTHYIPVDVVPAHLSQIHGHDYQMEITVRTDGNLSNEYGFQPAILDSYVSELLLKPFHGKFVNDLCNTGSSEDLCSELLKRLIHSPIGKSVVGIDLLETRKNTIHCLANRLE